MLKKFSNQNDSKSVPPISRHLSNAEEESAIDLKSSPTQGVNEVKIERVSYLKMHNYFKVNHMLWGMDDIEKNISTVPAKKKAQRDYFETSIKDESYSWRLDELVALLSYMNRVQQGVEEDHPFEIIRTEQNCFMACLDGNTRTWQAMVQALKQQVLKALINEKHPISGVQIRLPEKEYKRYHKMLANHSRVFRFDQPNSLVDFEKIFTCEKTRYKSILESP